MEESTTQVAEQHAEEPLEQGVIPPAPEAGTEPQSEPPKADPPQHEAKVEVPKEIDWKDRYLRLAADFDNHRKRTREEMRVAQRRELTRVLNDWLDVYDSTLRAIESATDHKSEWYTGLDAIRRQMDQALTKRGVKRLEMGNQRFDPRFHEAVAVIPAPAEEDGKILHTERAGFVFSDGEVLRAARVVVAKGQG